MRVLIVSQYFWPESFRINELAQSLTDRELSVDILTGKPNYPEGKVFDGFRAAGMEKSTWNGMKVWRIPIFPRGSKSSIRLALNYLSFLFSGLLFAPWLLRKQKYDVIFVYGLSPILQALPALFLGKLKEAKVVLWVQDLWPESLSATGYVKNPRVLNAVAAVVRFIYRKCNLVLVQSQAFKAKVQAMAPHANVVYYPNSGDPQFVRHGEHKHDATSDSWNYGFAVTFAGNVGAAQSIEVIVETAELLRGNSRVSFVIIGDGSRREWLETEIHRRGFLNVHLLGRYPYQAMPALFQKASVLLLTLKDDAIFNATIPSKVQAYLAAGKPIIGCLNGEGGRVIAEANVGKVVPAGNAQALAEAITQLSEADSQTLAQMGSNGRRYFSSHFDHETLVDELIAHFDFLLKKESKI